MFFRGIYFNFILEYISEPVFSYFYFSIEVESVLLLLPLSNLHNYLYFYLSKERVLFSHHIDNNSYETHIKIMES